jgi:transcriptional regulator with XRE-family HTH domain
MTFKVIFLDATNAMLNDTHKSTKSLKELRIQTGLTQYALAETLGIRQGTVCDWERGTNEPRISVSKVLLLCQTLNCSLEELVSAVETARNKDRDLAESQEEQQKQPVAA